MALLTLIFASILICPAQDQPPDNLQADESLLSDTLSAKVESQIQTQLKTEIPIGLFAYNKWVDLNENQLMELNEFFGLGKESFSKGEPISISLNVPSIDEGAELKLRIWDTSGSLIRTLKKKYTTKPFFSYSAFDSYLPVGSYIITVNTESSEKTYQLKFILTEPNGNSLAKLKEKLLPCSLHLFREWIDEDGDMKIDSTEVFGLNENEFDLGNVEFELGLNLPSSSAKVVYQVWDAQHELLSMKISNLDSLQHFSMQKDSLNMGNDFLRVLTQVPSGKYLITAYVAGEPIGKYALSLQIRDTTKVGATEESVQVDSELLEDSIPVTVKKTVPVTERVENLAPEFKKGQEGFFLFTGFIDMNENQKQEKNEFMGTKQDYFYSESENVFTQFNLVQYYDRELNLKIIDQDGDLVRELIGEYKRTPFVFKLSTPDDPLAPGVYDLILQPENAEIKYRIELNIR